MTLSVFHIISCSFHHFPSQYTFFSSTFECFFWIWDSWHFSTKAGLDLLSQSVSSGPPQLFALGCKSRRENTELGCFQCDFNSSSLSLAARMDFIQQSLLMQSLLICLSHYILDIKLPFSCFQEWSCDYFSSLHSAFPFLKGEQPKQPLKGEKKSRNHRWCYCFTFY